MVNLDAIVKELQQERDRLDAAIKVLTSLGSTSSRTRTARTMSAASRRKIAAAQRARWAKGKGQKVVPIRAGTRFAREGRRRISARGLANIRAAAKKRWAKGQGGKVISSTIFHCRRFMTRTYTALRVIELPFPLSFGKRHNVV
jgi:hypothetical protein